jgi:hypothetical protein
MCRGSRPLFIIYNMPSSILDAFVDAITVCLDHGAAGCVEAAWLSFSRKAIRSGAMFATAAAI